MQSIEYLFRRPGLGHHSIEALFGSVSGLVAESSEFCVSRSVAPCDSRGISRRVKNITWAYRRRHQADLFHITGDITYTSMALPSDRTIVTFHDARGLDEYPRLTRNLFSQIWVKSPCRHVAAITVVSQESARRILSHAPQAEDKLHVIPNAVNPVFQPAPRPFRSSRPQILQIGTGENKNVTRLANALKGLDCELHLVGRPNESTRRTLDECDLDYRVSSNITLQEVLLAYQDADLVTFCSTVEGFGMPILEAQWVERPIVTSNCSSMPEVAGANACLVDPFDISSIRSGIEKIIHDVDYRNSIVAAGRVNRERFTLQSVANMYMNLYRKVSARNQKE